MDETGKGVNVRAMGNWETKGVRLVEREVWVIKGVVFKELREGGNRGSGDVYAFSENKFVR